ncbi:MAG: AtpZ/AtpI family protein [Gemmatimonadaceae bacterium]|nr:AtpZ/AtpI family protein [Gemmatimonadaceae bacterium]
MTEEKQPHKAPSPTRGDPSPWAVAGLGMQFFVALIAFVYAGNWLDARVGTSPVFLFAGVFVGGGGSFYLSYRRLMRTAYPEDKPPTASRDGSVGQ